jgi:two-component system nitrogen regulation response regulator NtrX
MTASNILVVDDEADIRGLIEEILSEEGYDVATAADGTEARAQMGSGRPDLVLLDIWMPDVDGITLLGEWSQDGAPPCPVVVMSGHGTVETAVEATRLGAVDFVEKPLSLQKLLRTVERALAERQGPGQVTHRQMFPAMPGPIGKSAAVRELRERAHEMASHPAPVLLVGEPGSGREAVARFIHAAGDRRDRDFVRLVAASLPAENVALALLGSGDGEAGLLERAGNGVLFIDDLQALCPEGQRLLLGVLEQGSLSRLGESTPVKLACRVMASVTPEAAGDPAAHGLQPQLLARLSVLQLPVPSLRDYPEDISELLRQYVDRMVEAEGLPYRHFGVAAQNRLRNYPWPGNIEELTQLVRRMLLAQGDEEIGLAEVEEALRPVAEVGSQPLIKQDLLSLPLREAREQFERAYLIEQLKLCDGKVGRLAKRVGMERTHLYRKLRSLGVDFRHLGED